MVIGVGILALHRSTLTASLHAVRGSSPIWLTVAFLLMTLTFCIAAAIYGVLSLHRLRYMQTLLVELAGAFVNRLLPAGLGGLGLNGVYLYRQGHSPEEATAVVSANNALGIVANVLLLVVMFVVRPSVVRTLLSRHQLRVSPVWVVALIVVACVILLVPRIRRPLWRLADNLRISLRRLHRSSLLKALGLAACLTSVYTLVLFCVAHSLGITLSILQLFAVFSFGTLVGTATPTPGGLVGTEAGLFTGLVVYGVTDATAGAVVLLFRLMTYWLPLLPGVIALLKVRSRQLV